jgi:hypothetical protein
MTKEREDEAEEQDVAEGSPADDQPEISVKNEGGEATVEVSRESRKERREREASDRTRKLIEEAQKPLRDQLAMMANMRQAPQQQFVPPPAAAPAGADPEWKELVKRQTRLVALVRASTDREEIQRLEDEWHDAEYKKGEIIASKATESLSERMRRENPPAENPVHKMVRSEFPDVLNYGPDATNYATGLFLQEQAKASRERRPFDELATHRMVLAKTAEDFGLRPKSMPSRNPTQQARFATPGSNSTGSGSSGGPTRALTKAEKAMAIAFAGKGVPEAKAYTEWSNMMGQDYFRDT